MNRAYSILAWVFVFFILFFSGCIDKSRKDDDGAAYDGLKATETVTLKRLGGEVLVVASGTRVYLDPDEVPRDVEIRAESVDPAFYAGLRPGEGVIEVSPFVTFTYVDFQGASEADVTIRFDVSGIIDPVLSNIHIYRLDSSIYTWTRLDETSGRHLDAAKREISSRTGVLTSFVVGYRSHEPLGFTTTGKIAFSSARAYKYINSAGSVLSTGDGVTGICVYCVDSTVPAVVRTLFSAPGHTLLKEIVIPERSALLETGGAYRLRVLDGPGEKLLSFDSAVVSSIPTGLGVSPNGAEFVFAAVPVVSKASTGAFPGHLTTARDEIVKMGPGGGMTRLTFNDEVDIGPCFSRDGNRVYFTRVDAITGKKVVYYHDDSTGTDHRLTAPDHDLGGTSLRMMNSGTELLTLPQGRLIDVGTGLVKDELGERISALLPAGYSMVSVTDPPSGTPLCLAGLAVRIASIDETAEGAEMAMELVLADAGRGGAIGAAAAIYDPTAGILTLLTDLEFIEPEISRGFTCPVMNPRYLR